MSNIPELVENLIKLQQAYAHTPRVIVTEERYHELVESGVLKDYTFDSLAIREPLLEHVGHLPIIASYLYPHIEHKEQVNLGRVLIMASVHDIGETVVGDMLTYTKTSEHQEEELKAAKALLPDFLFEYLMEMEHRETMDAKFAKAVDSLAPLLHELPIPQVTLARFKFHGFNTDRIIAKKREHFEWDKVLLEVFDHVIFKYRNMESR